MSVGLAQLLKPEALRDLNRFEELFRHDDLRQLLSRPPKGWLRSVRTCAGIPAPAIAASLGVSRQVPLQLEVAENEDRITLKSLRSMADALGCDLVYALVPREGMVRDNIAAKIQAKSGRDVNGRNPDESLFVAQFKNMSVVGTKSDTGIRSSLPPSKEAPSKTKSAKRRAIKSRRPG
jgi:hypothetical protein